MRFRTFSLFLAALALLSATVVDAQNASPLAGKWEGALVGKETKGSRTLGGNGPPTFPTVILITTASDGTFRGTWASTRQQGRPAEIGDVTIVGDTVRIDVPKWRGVWEGKLSPDGSTLDGKYSQQGQTLPLVLRRTGNAEDGASIHIVNPGVVSR